MIIARSGLSTGAVYGYFKGKDQIINVVERRRPENTIC
jgi:AcrR family transcriptional regulator